MHLLLFCDPLCRMLFFFELPHMNNPGQKPVIGIVGGIGAGKSTVAGELAALGCGRIDADKIGHDLLTEQDVKDAIRANWGGEIFDPSGSIDRSKLAARVFDDPAELTLLNEIMQPRIRLRMQQQIEGLLVRPDVPAVVMDAAIMLEAGWNDLCTHLIFVEAPDDVRAGRVQRSRGWDRATWQQREKSQISLDRKLRRCYFNVDNSSSVSYLREQVRQIFNQIVQADRPQRL